MSKLLPVLMMATVLVIAASACSKKKYAMYIPPRKNHTAQNDKKESAVEEQNKMLGIISQPAQRTNLTQNIRLPGRVVNDTELFNSQQEYLSAYQNQDRKLVESAEYRLKLLGYKPADLEKLIAEGKPDKTLLYPGERAWVIADIYEMDVGRIKVGQKVLLSTAAYPGKTFEGRVRFVESSISPESRTAKTRITVDNSGSDLKSAGV